MTYESHLKIGFTGFISSKIMEWIVTLQRDRKMKCILTDEEIHGILNTLQKYSLETASEDEEFISYTGFLIAKEEVPSKARRYFKATTFVKLCHGDKLTRLKIEDFCSFLLKLTWNQRAALTMTTFDTMGSGYLVESELEDYLATLVPTLRHLDGMEKSFLPFYLCTVSRKFFFFLDPMRVGRVRICDILASGFLDSIWKLKSAKVEEKDPDWFTLSSVQSVYMSFVELDANKDGSISREELSKLTTEYGRLKRAFVNQVFSVLPTENGTIDYRVYVDLVLALTNRQTEQSVRFLFGILDTFGSGRLDISTLEFYFNNGEPRGDPVYFRNFFTEIHDIIKPKDPNFITVEELIKSGYGGTILDILVDGGEADFLTID